MTSQVDEKLEFIKVYMETILTNPVNLDHNCFPFDDKFCNAELISTENSVETFDDKRNVVYKMADKYYNIEYHSENLEEKDLMKFFCHNVKLMEKFQTLDVYTIIFNNGEFNDEMYYKTNLSYFRPYIIQLSEFNVNLLWLRIEDKMEKRKKINIEDTVILTSLPIYKTEKNKKELLDNVYSNNDQIHKKGLDNIEKSELLLLENFAIDVYGKILYFKKLKMEMGPLDFLIDE